MNLHKIKAQFRVDGRGFVELDGKPLTTTRVQIDAAVDAVPVVTLSLLCEQVDVETDGELVADDGVDDDVDA